MNSVGTVILQVQNSYGVNESAGDKRINWSSTTNANNTDLAWVVTMNYGFVSFATKTDNSRLWPVRGGQ